MTKEHKDFEVLSSFVHGAVFLGNLLGAVSNAQKKSFTWTTIHIIGMGIHLFATLKHLKETKS